MNKILILITLILGSMVPSYAALGLSQCQTATTASGTAVTVNITSTTGNLLIAFTTQGQNTTSTVAMSDSASNTWTQTVSGYNATGTTARSAMFYVANATGVTSITATWSGSLTQDVDIIACEVSGAASSSPEDTSVNGGNASSATSAVSGTFTTTNANDILFLGVRIRGSYTSATAGSGYTIPTNGTQQRSAIQYDIVSATQSSTTTSLSWTTAHPNQNIFVALKAAVGSSPVSPPVVL